MKRNLNKLILFAIILCAVISALVACSAVEFKLEFIVDGKVYATINTNGKEVIEMPGDPTKEGYVFDGWYYDEGIWEKPFTANSLLDTPLSESMKVYAKWNEEYCTITYNLNGGQNNSENPSGYIPGNEIILQAPTKLGYTFLGWYSDSNFNTKVTQIASESTGNIELWAKWEAIEYTIIYNLGGGINNLNNPSSYTIGNGEIILEDPSKRGYFFDGWYNANGERVYFINPNDLKEIELFARWKLEEYTITYELNGGINSDLNIFKYDILSNTIILHNPTKTSCTFEGWYTTAEFLPESKVYEIKSGSVGDIMVYAKWLEYRIESAPGFEIDYSQSTPKVSRVVANNVVNIDLNSSINVSPNCTWKLYADFIGNNEYKLKAMTLEVGNNIAYIIVFHPDGEHFQRYELNIYRLDIKEYEFINEQERYHKGTIEESGEINAPASPIKANYDFIGWTVNGELVSFPYKIYNNTQFIAKYLPTAYKIKYELNGGTIEDEITEYNIETNIEYKEPIKKGYAFDGWYLTKDFSSERVYETGLGMYGDITIYAKWQTVDYEIIYNLNGGENNQQNPQQYNIETKTIELQKPTKKGYVFKGWYSESTFVNQVTEIASGSTGDVKLWAKWEAVEYIITYHNLNGAINTNATYYTIESEAIVLEKPTKNGYTFQGWYSESTYENQVTEIASGSTGNVELWAKWQVNTYEIVFNANGENVQGVMKNQEHTYDSLLALSENEYTRKGYTFVGWNSQANGEGESYTDRQEIGNLASEQGAQIILYAQWKIIEYTITYNLDGGENNRLNKEVFTINDLPIQLYNPTKEEYLFEGWYINDYSQKISQINDCIDIELNAVFAIEGIQYTLSKDNTHYIISAYNGNASELIINDSYRGMPINAIAENAFNGCQLLSIIIAENIAIIGASAFENCHKLTIYCEVESKPFAWDDNWNISGCPVIWDCKNNNMTEDNYQYVLVDGLRYAVKDDIAIVVGNNAIGDIVIPSTIVYNNEEYRVTSILNNAFAGYGCSNLTSIIIPNSVISIGIMTFYNCDNLTKVIFEEGSQLTNIGDYAFSGCSNLISITIPNSVTSIESGAFYNCINLTDIIIPQNIISIGYEAFINCYKLTIYCEVESKPLAWDDNWNISGCPVIWDCNNNDTAEDNYQYVLIDGLRYAIKDDIAIVVGNNAIGDIVIPSTIVYNNEEHRVTSILDNAFAGCKGLTGVVISDGIEDIGVEAFAQCENLTSIIIPDSVTYIGKGIFKDCKNLQSITTPFIGEKDGFNENGTMWFMYGFDSIEDSINWTYQLKLQKIVITNATTINQLAFAGFYTLTSVYIPKSVYLIADCAFYYCYKLTIYCEAQASVEDEWNKYIVGDYNWNFNESYDCLVIWDYKNNNLDENGYEHIEIDGFRYAVKGYEAKLLSSNLSGDITIPSKINYNGREYNVTSIESSAFIFQDITSVIIPSSMQYIGTGAFGGFDTLMIYCEASTKPIGWADNWCLDNCIVFWAFDIESGEDKYKVIELDDIIYAINGKNAIVVDVKNISDNLVLSSIIIYDNNIYYVSSIGNSAFSGCSNLTSITIPDSVTSIGNSAFSGCSNLTSITIPDSVTSIGNSVFSGCSNLTSITIPDSVTSIGNSVFLDCVSLTSIIIPKNVTIIEDGLFAQCYNLQSITIPQGVTRIGKYAFLSCTSLTSIIIPKNVTIIEDSAFTQCINLTSITLSQGVISIGDNVFENCGSLTSIIIPDSVTNIGSNAFRNCDNLTSIIFVNPNNWQVSTSSDFSSYIEISSDELSNASTATTYLKSAYFDYYWRRVA